MDREWLRADTGERPGARKGRGYLLSGSVRRGWRVSRRAARPWVVAALLYAAGVPTCGAESLALTGAAVAEAPVRANLLANPGFEDAPGDLPSGWSWGRGRADADCLLDREEAHGGRHSLKLVNRTGAAPHVYGSLWQPSAVKLQPGRPYTFSLFVRSEDGGGTLIAGRGWQFRLALPDTDGRWRRVWMTFTPGEADTPYEPRIIVENRTRGVWIDDLKLEQAEGPSPVPLDGPAARPLLEAYPDPAGTEIQGDGPFALSFTLVAPQPLGRVSLEAVLDRPRVVLRSPLRLDHAASRLTLRGRSSAVSRAPRALRLRLLKDGKLLAATTTRLRFLSSLNAERRLQALRSSLPALRRSLRSLAARGEDPSYPLVTYTVLESFAGYVKEDLTGAGGKARPEVRRAVEQLDDLEAMAARLRRDLQLSRSGRLRFPRAPRWTGARRPRVSGPSFIGPVSTIPPPAAALRSARRAEPGNDHHQDTKAPRVAVVWESNRSAPGNRSGRPTPSGRAAAQATRRTIVSAGQRPRASTTERPIFFTGYGHFGQVRADVERFPRYGTNIIQVEVGPSALFPEEGKVSEAPIRELKALLARAERAGVAVCLLISPHYLPQWMLEKYPDLRKRREGFLQYSLYAPEGQALLRRFIRTLLEPVKDSPALHSICLSNEPVNREEPSANLERAWREWLRGRHGDIGTLNERWGARYASFEEVPVPNLLEPPEPSPFRSDALRWNQEWFAGWHRMLADAVHAVAPDLPVHAKAMTWTFLNDQDAPYGVDAFLFGGFSQINGNDSSNLYAFGQGDFAQNWQGNAMPYDLQRSVRDAPILNSENHLIADRDLRPVPPQHIRAALWQQAVHGQSATTIWVWERTFDPKSDFAGSIMHRPACAEAVGRVNLDLNRAALEVTALQKAPPHVLLLQSTSSAAWAGGAHTDALSKLYTALAFTGLKVGFITERQLEQGQVPSAPLLFVPAATYLSEAAYRSLQRYEGQVVYLGEDSLSRDEYGRPREERLPGERLRYEYGRTEWRQLWWSLRFQLARWGAVPALEVRGEKGGPVWGVEWRSAAVTGGQVVNLFNCRQSPMRITLSLRGRAVSASDVLTGERVTGTLTLQPLETRLLRVAEP